MSLPFGVYIHIPFCKSKCRYCDFYSAGGSHLVPDEYIDALIREYHSFCAINGRRKVDTLYFGGGTPSLLSAANIQKILTAIAPTQNAEITLEANPESVDFAKLCEYKKAGINRLSFGVQTANDKTLQVLGRLHSADTARTALAFAQKAGFDNISGDIMLALPSYSFTEIDDTISLLSRFCTHISAYMLKIEKNTPFYNARPNNIPTEDEAAEYYLYCVQKLFEGGYFQYEISNFSKPGYESRHNLIYWDKGDYLGLGAGAHSCINKNRFYYPSSTSSFINECSVVMDGKFTSQDYIILALRLNKGLNLRELKSQYNINLINEKSAFIARLVSEGLALLQNDILCLTPRGMLVQNSILCELL